MNATGASDSPMQTSANQIFISYAWEDRVAADWLTLRLTAAGYRVWCDRFKLLGGERFPERIDDAIRERTFRIVGLLSRHSLHKPNPEAERTLALALGRERNIDFYIPLDLEGLDASQLPWMISNVTFIPFMDRALGLRQLLKKLESINAPRDNTNGGNQAVLDALCSGDVVRDEPESVYTNCFRVRTLPKQVRIFALATHQGSLPAAIADPWPHQGIGGQELASFSAPPDVHGYEFIERENIGWTEADRIGEVHSRHLVSNLIRQSIRSKLLLSGLREDPGSRMIHYPRTVPGKELKLPYTPPQGRQQEVQATGERHFTDGSVYRYHLAPTFWIRSDMGSDFWAQLTLRVQITDRDGKNIATSAAFSRRRHLTKNWFNHQWLTRQLAVMRHLSDGSDALRIGSGEELIEIEAMPLSGEVRPRISDAALTPLRDGARPPTDVIDDNGDLDRGDKE